MWLGNGHAWHRLRTNRGKWLAGRIKWLGIECLAHCLAGAIEIPHNTFDRLCDGCGCSGRLFHFFVERIEVIFRFWCRDKLRNNRFRRGWHDWGWGRCWLWHRFWSGR